jgi:hypothetical protein
VTDVDELAAADARRSRPAGDLAEIKDLARQARELEFDIADLKETIKRREQQLDNIMTRELPERLDAVGLRSITVEAHGNIPAFRVEVSTFYNANIAAKWDEERRQAAFDWLDAHGHGDLIKTEVETFFKREDRDNVRNFCEGLRINGYDYTVKATVHPQTLKAWLREMIEERHETPPLDIIGGYVERQATIKPEE